MRKEQLTCSHTTKYFPLLVASFGFRRLTVELELLLPWAITAGKPTGDPSAPIRWPMISYTVEPDPYNSLLDQTTKYCCADGRYATDGLVWFHGDCETGNLGLMICVLVVQGLVVLSTFVLTIAPHKSLSENPSAHTTKYWPFRPS
ncbi:MAG: hypothetical protein HY207_05220 [Nitrospirae bacterium]|nr:hypothetical protein [Nitrospirota bacterium]